MCRSVHNLCHIIFAPIHREVSINQSLLTVIFVEEPCSGQWCEVCGLHYIDTTINHIASACIKLNRSIAINTEDKGTQYSNTCIMNALKGISIC